MIAFKCGCRQVGVNTHWCDNHREESEGLEGEALGTLLERVWSEPQLRVCSICQQVEGNVAFGWNQPWCDNCQEDKKRRSQPLEVRVAEDVSSGEAGV